MRLSHRVASSCTLDDNKGRQRRWRKPQNDNTKKVASDKWGTPSFSFGVHPTR